MSQSSVYDITAEDSKVAVYVTEGPLNIPSITDNDSINQESSFVSLHNQIYIKEEPMESEDQNKLMNEQENFGSLQYDSQLYRVSKTIY